MAGPENQKRSTMLCGDGVQTSLIRIRKKRIHNNTTDTKNSASVMKNNAAKTPAVKNLRTCKNGHQYYKSSDCPVCPICEKERKPKDNFLSFLSAPARRALENENITSLKILSQKSESYLLSLHGLGPGTIPKLRKALANAGFTFSKK